jgi:parvulin-like peptidyl-prolyl isomerase
MKKAVVWLILLGLVAGGAVWMIQSRPPPPPPPDEKKDAIVAAVGSKRLLLSELETEYGRYLALHNMEKPQGRDNDLGVKKIVLNKMIEGMFLEEEADRKQVAVSDTDLNQEIDRLLGPGGEKERDLNMATRSNITMAEWRVKVRRSMRIHKLIVAEIDAKATVDEAQIKAYYAENKDIFKWPERVRALQIMSKDETSAELIRKKLGSGKPTEEAFMALAREKSISPDAAKGGDLGFFSRGQMPKEFEDAVFGLKPGQVSDVVTTVHGFHIFKLINREAPRPMTLDEARDKIAEIIRDHKREKEFSGWIDKLKKETKIEVYAGVLTRRAP